MKLEYNASFSSNNFWVTPRNISTGSKNLLHRIVLSVSLSEISDTHSWCHVKWSSLMWGDTWLYFSLRSCTLTQSDWQDIIVHVVSSHKRCNLTVGLRIHFVNRRPFMFKDPNGNASFLILDFLGYPWCYQHCPSPAIMLFLLLIV